MTVARILAAAIASGLAATAQANDWYQWRGPARDGKSAATGLLKQWPDGGPKLLWTAEGIGGGYSCITEKDGLVYTTGDTAGKFRLTVLDRNGQVARTIDHGPAWTGQYPGARSVPTIEGDRMYLMNAHGVLNAYERLTGKVIWSVDLMKTFGARLPRYGYAESVLVEGDKVICTPGGPDACLVALDKSNGSTVWTSKGLSDPSGYASPIAFESGGIRQVCTFTSRGVVAVEAATGRFLWRYDRPANTNRPNISDPLYFADCVFASSGYGNGGGLVRLASKDGQVTAAQAWDTKQLINHHGAMIYLDGYIYGNHGETGWACLEAKTGRQVYFATGVGKGSITYADGMLYCYGEKDGLVGLVRATPEKYDLVSTFRVPRGGKGPYWAHPVVSNGRLYLRYDSRLFCYDIKAPPAPAGETAG